MTDFVADAERALLERLCALLIAGRGHELGNATSRRAVLEVLGGELPADHGGRGCYT